MSYVWGERVRFVDQPVHSLNDIVCSLQTSYPDTRLNEVSDCQPPFHVSLDFDLKPRTEF